MTAATNILTAKIRDEWDSQAESWYRQRESLLKDSRPIHDCLVKGLEPREGQHLLEIAAGPGDTGFTAARQLRDGRLLSTDISPRMVASARKRGAELGINNVDYKILDAQAMDLEDASFDGVICRWGIMLMPDPEAALRECRRVLKPGGRLSLAVFTGPNENPFASIPARIMIGMGYLKPPSSDWQPGILSLADRALLQSKLEGAGFGSIRIEAVDFAWTFRATSDYWDFLVDLTALGPLIRSLPVDASLALRQAIDERLSAYRQGSGIALPSRCWCGVAIK